MIDLVRERFELARKSNPRLVVDYPAIWRALDDYADVVDVERHAIDCAEWLGAQRKRRFAAPTLRRWLRDKPTHNRLTDYIDWMYRRFPDVERSVLEGIINREGPLLAHEVAERLERVR